MLAVMETVAEEGLTEQESEAKYATRGTNITTNPLWCNLLQFRGLWHAGGGTNFLTTQ